MTEQERRRKAQRDDETCLLVLALVARIRDRLTLEALAVPEPQRPPKPTCRTRRPERSHHAR